jgi:3-isopropylmalate/(R)-2-methylmalate dehydratase small subunit
MLNGLDDIGLTLQKDSKIKAFEDQMSASQPWAVPVGNIAE